MLQLPVQCCNAAAAKPGLLDLKGRKKWDAWSAKQGEVCHATQCLPCVHNHSLLLHPLATY